jgi:hypothetical protein
MFLLNGLIALCYFGFIVLPAVSRPSQIVPLSLHFVLLQLLLVALVDCLLGLSTCDVRCWSLHCVVRGGGARLMLCYACSLGDLFVSRVTFWSSLMLNLWARLIGALKCVLGADERDHHARLQHDRQQCESGE